MEKRSDDFKLKNKFFKSSNEIHYETIFKNHENLIEAYGNVLKYDLQKIEMKLLFRSYFVQSHIYKMLKLLKKIYLTEMASCYSSDNYHYISLNLNKFIHDIDKLSENLFYFSYLKIFMTSIPVIAAVLGILSQTIDYPDILWNQMMESYSFLMLLQSFILVFLLYLVVAAISFIDKRRIFIYPENKPRNYFDLWKMRYNAFVGKNKTETVYLKENILFKSLGMEKKPELEIDIFLLIIFVIFLLSLFKTFNSTLFSLAYLIGAILLIFFMKKRGGTV